ncbi:hypothetical protein [Lonepinella sp. MS14437]|uniref:hypothetical protein n=1 Tax=Lonepinella sp. MS14437 TaxID=3003620 RepID=UPI0036DA0C1D
MRALLLIILSVGLLASCSDNLPKCDDKAVMGKLKDILWDADPHHRELSTNIVFETHEYGVFQKSYEELNIRNCITRTFSHAPDKVYIGDGEKLHHFIYYSIVGNQPKKGEFLVNIWWLGEGVRVPEPEDLN